MLVSPPLHLRDCSAGADGETAKEITMREKLKEAETRRAGTGIIRAASHFARGKYNGLDRGSSSLMGEEGYI